MQYTQSIFAQIHIGGHHAKVPYIQQREDKDPNNVHKVPINNGQIQRQTLTWLNGFQQEQTNNQIQEANDYVLSMKSCGQIKTSSKLPIRHGKCLTSIFSLLHITKQNPQENGQNQLISTTVFFSLIQCIFCLVCSKIGRLQQYTIYCWQTGPINRHNSYRRPRHSNLNRWHQSLVQECPQKSSEENRFTHNKQHHSQIKTIFYFRGMKSIHTFSDHITPPDTHRINKTNQSQKQYRGSSIIFMEKQNQTNLQPQHTQTCESGPWAQIHQMIRMVRSSRCVGKFTDSILCFFGTHFHRTIHHQKIHKK